MSIDSFLKGRADGKILAGQCVHLDSKGKVRGCRRDGWLKRSLRRFHVLHPMAPVAGIALNRARKGQPVQIMTSSLEFNFHTPE
jgi:hypothetical protein